MLIGIKIRSLKEKNKQERAAVGNGKRQRRTYKGGEGETKISLRMAEKNSVKGER